MMRPFDTLTRRGQARRLRVLALRAMDSYALPIAGLRLAGMHTNTLFRVRTVGGPAYILRVCTAGWRTETDLRSEAMWLQALHRDTNIGAPEPIPTRSGDFVFEASVDGVPGPRLCLLMSWIPGPLLATQLTESYLFAMGVLFARLHEHGARFSPPEGFTRRRMNTINARGEDDVLFRDACREAFTPRTRETLERALAVVRGAFDHLYADPAELQVIHNDLHHENIKIDRGRLRPFDFEDTVWGFPVQDIAMALQDLMLDVEPGEYDPLLAAFRDGYESRRPWPESGAGQIDTFRAGRLLWVANYVARYERKHLQGYLGRIAPMLDRFLDTGALRKG